MTAPRILVLAKAPVPGRVKTRLCPPCTPGQAARIAAAALADTLDAAGAGTLVIDGDQPAPAGWTVIGQRGGPLGERLTNAFQDAGGPAVLIGMDTPQVTTAHLDTAVRMLTSGWDAVFGPADDGGWWALGLRDPGHAVVLRDIATSTATTGPETLDALRRRGLRVHLLDRMRDVDTAADARTVAGLCLPGSRFARAVATELPVVEEAFDAALRRAEAGVPATFTARHASGAELRFDPAAWCRAAIPGDAGLLARCTGPTLDIGCGPGRLTSALTESGHPALGIDRSATAVRLARARGAAALQRDVFDPVVPGTGRWRHLLLADGNIGIGGDPHLLLRRCHELLAPGGTLHTELAAPGTPAWSGTATVQTTGSPLRWASVPRDRLSALASATAMRIVETWTEAGRWFVTLTPR